MSRIQEAEAARRISDAVDALGGELVEFLQEIVRIPTETPPGKNYPECAKAVGRKMEEAGLAVEYVEVPDDLLIGAKVMALAAWELVGAH
jgi:acetylornithine deacetylase/succinyl-diaminopimelate desuccinylase-like protein